MRVVRVRGLKEYRDRHGKLRRYHRASGTAIDASLEGAELAARVAELDKAHSPVSAKAGTLGGLLESFKRSTRFLELADRTRADYRKIMDYLAPLAGTPIALTTPGFFAKLRDKTIRLKKAGFTNHMLAMLSSAFEHGKEYELVESNPVTGMRKARVTEDRKRRNEAWSPDERDNVFAVIPAQLKIPFLLARYFGLRLGDCPRVPLNAYKDGWLNWRAGKNKAMLTLPISGAARADLEAAIGERPQSDSTLMCLTLDGTPWTKGGLSHMLGQFFKACVTRGILRPHRTLHGLRHSIGAELRGAGFDREQRKLFLGHDTDDMAEHYSASADVRGQLIDMAKRLDTKAK